MPDPKVVQGEEYQHGEVQAQEALEQANPIPDEELPPVQPEQVVEEALAPKEEKGPTSSPEPWWANRQSNQLLIPHKYETGRQPKMRAEVERDVGILWEVIAGDFPMLRNMARALTGRG